jgi:hypothetical protein
MTNPTGLREISGRLAVGYNDSERGPWKYTVSEDQKLDVQFLKVFVSTSFIDLSDVEQKTPFEGPREDSEAPRKLPISWDTITISVVQYREQPQPA